MTLHKLSLCGSLACWADDLSVLLKMWLQAEAAGTRNMPTSHGFILIKLITREQADCGIYASCLIIQSSLFILPRVMLQFVEAYT